MKKFTIALLLLVVLSVGAFASNDVALIINGKTPALDVPSMIQEGRTLVPLRAIFEALGQEVEWVADTQAIVSSFDGKEIKLTVGSKEAINKGVATILDVPPMIKDGRTLVPLRFIAESLDRDVEWIADTRMVVINDKSDKPKEEKEEEEKNELNVEFVVKKNDWVGTIGLFIKDAENVFGIDEKDNLLYETKTVCLNNDDLNQRVSYTLDGKVKGINRSDDWREQHTSYIDSSGDLEIATVFLTDKEFKSFGAKTYATKVNDGDLLKFEVNLRNKDTKEVTTLYYEFILDKSLPEIR